MWDSSRVVIPRRLALLGLAIVAQGGCGDGASADDDDDDGVDAAAGTVDAAPPGPDADPGPCNSVVQHFASEAGTHVPPETDIEWSSNPPSTGEHFAVWAKWNRTYETPLARGNWVHNLEHGGVVLLFDCPGGCAADVTALEALEDALPADPRCVAPLRTRTLITPDPLLPEGVQIAAAAWGWTYTAECFDAQRLGQFVEAHYAEGPEDLCNDGALP